MQCHPAQNSVQAAFLALIPDQVASELTFYHWRDWISVKNTRTQAWADYDITAPVVVWDAGEGPEAFIQ